MITMFNFKLTKLWLFGIIIIALTISMIWYNNASIEGFGNAPASGSDVLTYYPSASTSLVDFGLSNEHYFDISTGNIIRNYDQTMTVVDRVGNKRKYIKSELETVISTENNEVDKGITYPAFTIYETSDDVQLFYISIGTKTFIHSVDLNTNRHGSTRVFDGITIKEEINTDAVGIEKTSGTIPTVSLNSEGIDISGITVTAMKLTDGLHYDAINQLLIQKVINEVVATVEDASIGVDTNIDANAGEDATTVEDATTGEDATTVEDATTENFTLFNNRLSDDEIEGFTTIDETATLNIFNRNGVNIMDTYTTSAAYTAGANPTTLNTKILTNQDNTLQVVMMTHSSHTVILILTNVGNVENNKYKLMGALRYVGTNREQPTTATKQSTIEPDDAKKEEGSDLTDSAMSEYWKWFHYWNADGGSSGGSQPMSQDYMLKTDYVPMVCPSCSSGGKCANCENGHNHNGGGNVGTTGGSAVKKTSGGGIVGTTGGIANNIIDETSKLTEKAIDTGGEFASGTVDLGRDAVTGSVGLGRDAVTGSVGLGRDAADIGRDVVTGTVGLGRDAVTGTVGLGRDAVTGTVGLGRDVVSGALGLGRDVVGGTADFIKDTKYANAGGYASGSNGDIQTKKYVRGQGVQPGGMDPYTYNGLLSKRGGSNYMPITSDFSSFR
jgi:hypothetical protein